MDLIIHSFIYRNITNSSDFTFEKLAGDASCKKEFYKVKQFNKETGILLIKISKTQCDFDELFDDPLPKLSQYDYFKYTFTFLSETIGNVPKILMYDDDNGIILMQHISDLRCKEYILTLFNNDRYQVYTHLVDWLIKLAKLNKLSSSVTETTTVSNNNNLIKQRKYTTNTMLDEFHSTYVKWVDTKNSVLLQTRVNEVVRMPVNEVVFVENLVESISESINRDPIFCHRDYQIRNVMITDDYECSIIDTQDMCMGPIGFDLACLLYDSNTLDMTAITRELLCYRYYDRLRELITESFESFMNKIRIMGLLRILKSYGVHSKYYIRDKREISRKSIENNKILLNELTLDYFPELHQIMKQQGRHLVPVILAAGKGSRMKSQLPKTLCEINGKPMLFYILDQIMETNPVSIIIVVGHKKEQIIHKVTSEYPFKNIQFVTQDKMLGTAHALIQTTPILQDLQENTDVLVLYGDKPCILQSTIKSLLQTYYKSESDACLLTYNGPTSTTKCGRIIRNSKDEIIQIYEDPSEMFPSNEFNGGVQVYRKSSLVKYLPQIGVGNAQGEYYLPDIVKLMVNDGKHVTNIVLPPTNAFELFNVNTPEDLAKAAEYLK